MMSRLFLLSFLAIVLFGVLWIGNPAVAFAAGLAIALWQKQIALPHLSTVSRYALQGGIVLLGFGIQASQLWTLTTQFAWVVTLYIGTVIMLGVLGARLLRLAPNEGHLITGGTAICGGTAVVTLAPIIGARPAQTGAVLGIIFLLNAFALLTFPIIGHALDLNQTQFGLWAALAIHDTASVVATAQIYGDEAAQVATTLKLGRTLWLVPAVLVLSFWYRSESNDGRIPTFVFLFIGTSLAGSFFALPDALLSGFNLLSKGLLVIALFLIGLTLSMEAIRSIRFRTLAHALGLWCLLAPLTLILIKTYVP
ncbi:MAG: YeiH family protein [Pseudomonadales bacterium]